MGYSVKNLLLLTNGACFNLSIATGAKMKIALLAHRRSLIDQTTGYCIFLCVFTC
jgi:hypothetical protein